MDPRRILFVDDDDLITRMAEMVLRRLHCEFRICSDGGTAMAAFREAPASYRLVICDVRLGTGSGLELARQVKALEPATPVLLISGRAESSEASQAAALGAIGPLSKAEALADLGGLVERFGLVA